MTDLSDLLEGPPKHLERYSPPWAADRWTVCGRILTDVAEWLPFDEAKKLIKRIGATRARLILCQTCLAVESRIERPAKWDANPAEIVNDYTRHYGPWRRLSAEGDQVRAELLALARLTETHLDEFNAMVHAYKTDEISSRRKARQ